MTLSRCLAGRGSEVTARRSGIFWHLDLKEGIDFSIWLLGGFEPRTVKQYQALVSPGATVIDVGANIGAHTLPFAKLVGPGGRVLAFEPTLWAFEKLQRNLQLNPELSARVQPLQAMLVADRGDNLEQNIYSSWPLDAQDGLHEQHRGRLMTTAGARTMTLDDAVAGFSLRRIDFIKIDVDGHEHAVLRGALETLKAYKPRILMELAVYDRADFDDLIRLIDRCGYVPFHAVTRKRLPLDPAQMIRHIPAGGSINALLEHA